MGKHTELQSTLEELASTVAGEVGVELVELSLRGSSRRRLLRLDIDRAGPRGVNHEDCRRVSEAMDRALEDADLVPGAFVLDVSSPGLDRPIDTEDDYRRNSGRKVVVDTVEPIEGLSCFRGTLLGLADGCLRLGTEGDGEVRIPLGQVAGARQDVEI